MSDNAAGADVTRVSGKFFAIDRGAFRCAAVGGLNVAVAYLVMARGTGPDNRMTHWSMHSHLAAERHAGSAIIQSDNNGGDE
jgi:hypothetical protein